jgi:rhodanese-related sulfurtransferase
MKKIALILLVLLPAFVKADFKTLSTEQVQDKIKQELVIIDVRRQDEYQQYGIIPNAHKLTFFDKNGKYNIERWLRDLSKAKSNFCPIGDFLNLVLAEAKAGFKKSPSG